jgi:hypothetical protein
MQETPMSSKFTSRTSWREKLERQQEARIVNIPPKMQRHLGKGTMVIPRPLDVDALIRKVLAKRSRVDVACPLTTGIFIRIAAEAAEEQRRAGTKAVTPYWRVLSSQGGLNPKFPGGIAAQRRRLSAEGHRISKPQGKKPSAVVDFEKCLTRFSSN